MSADERTHLIQSNANTQAHHCRLESLHRKSGFLCVTLPSTGHVDELKTGSAKMTMDCKHCVIVLSFSGIGGMFHL